VTADAQYFGNSDGVKPRSRTCLGWISCESAEARRPRHLFVALAEAQVCLKRSLSSLWEFLAQPVGPGSNGKGVTEMSKKGRQQAESRTQATDG
jgi:hypothetical protein